MVIKKKIAIILMLCCFVVFLLYYIKADSKLDYKDVLNNFEGVNEFTGKGVRIAVIDSGLDEYSDLNISNTHLFNFTESNTVYDENGHGTQMINILYNKKFGIAPGAEIYSLKVLNEDCIGNYSDIVKAIEWCLDNKIQIINLSFSTSTDYPQLKEAIRKANDSGIIVFSSLFNSFSTKNYPADYDKVFGIFTDLEMYKENNYRIFSPYKKFYTINEVEGCIGNSPATAFCTGICARLIEQFNCKNISYNSENIFFYLNKILKEN